MKLLKRLFSSPAPSDSPNVANLFVLLTEGRKEKENTCNIFNQKKHREREIESTTVLAQMCNIK